MAKDRTPPPSPSASAPVTVLAVPERLPLVVRFLGPVRGLELHWHQKRPVPCAGAADCPQSIHRTSIIWKGYAAVQLWDPAAKLWRAHALAVTSHLEERLRGRDLRGEVWSVWRDGERGKNDPVYGVLCERLDPSTLTPAFDLLPILLRLYHVRSLRLDIPNETPARIVVAPTADAPPHIPADLVPEVEGSESPEDRERLRQLWRELRAGIAGTGKPADPKPADPARNGHAPPRPAGS